MMGLMVNVNSLCFRQRVFRQRTSYFSLVQFSTFGRTMKSAQYADSLPELISPNEKQSSSYFSKLCVSMRESFFKFCCSFLLAAKKSFGKELHFRGILFLL
jgi:hypothetical protein